MVAGSIDVAWGEKTGHLFSRTLGNTVPQVISWFGFSVESIGDLTGDGVADLVVGAPQQTLDGIAQQGKVSVFSGRDGTILLTLLSPSPQPQANFGEVVAVSDINRDGISDLVVGVRLQDVDGKEDQGAVHVFSGADGTLLSAIEAPIPQAHAFFGAALAPLYDRSNQTGRAEIVVGAPQQSFGDGAGEGAAFMLSATTGEPLSVILHPDPQDGAAFGWAVESVGDLDGDVVPDFIVGAPFQTVSGRELQGQVYVFSGGSVLSGQTVERPAHMYTLNFPDPDMPSARFGFALASIHDVNDDGVPDLVVGAPTADFGDLSNRGSAFIFSGADGMLLRTLTDPAPLQDAFFGAALISPGDVDGDGIADVAVGAPTPVTRGSAFVQPGRVLLFSGASGEHLVTLDPPSPGVGASFGFSLAAVGDVDGDGMPDLLAGAPFHDVTLDEKTHAAQGEAFVIDGLGPDLKGKVLEVVRTVTVSGQDRLDFMVKIKNRGTVKTTVPFKVKVHISNDEAFDGGTLDPRVAKWKVVESLSPGASIILTGVAEFNESVAGKFLLVRVDPKNEIAEKQEGNNIKRLKVPG